MLVWIRDTTQAGRIAHENGEYIFAYDRDAPEAAALSLTMPVETKSYDWQGELHPIFQMNLPEGALRASFDAMFSKAIQNYSDLDVLRIMGQSQFPGPKPTSRTVSSADGAGHP